MFRRDHKKRKGGGVGIYVCESYRSSSFFSSDNFEVIWVKLQLPLATILLNRGKLIVNRITYDVKVDVWRLILL